MGKAFKRWKNRLRKEGKLKDKEPPHRGPCEFCDERGGEILHCTTCEALVAAGKRKAGTEFTVQHCDGCREKAMSKIKAHTLLAHPYNILRVTAAALKGEL